MEFDCQKKEKYCLYKVDGDIDLYSAHELKEDFERNVLQGIYEYVINLSRVPYMDSSGLGALVYLVTHVKKYSGIVYLTDLTPSVNKLLELSRLNNFFKITKSENDALSDLQTRGKDS